MTKDNPIRVALESTVITHGLPKPRNLQLARDMECVIRENGAKPATIAVIDGKITVGLTSSQIEYLSKLPDPIKISRRDFATAAIRKLCGGTTVAGTLFAAHQAGIKIFATGGIGGVHDVCTLDISTDLQALSDTPLIVVCAGAKAILDLPATLEYLETMSVPVVGFRTDEFPAFYSRQSGLPVSVRLDSSDEITDFAKFHWSQGMKTSILVCQPLPAKDEIPREKAEDVIQQAQKEAQERGIRGQSLTPFLLSRLSELTGGESLRANIELLLNNGRLAAEIAVSWANINTQKML